MAETEHLRVSDHPLDPDYVPVDDVDDEPILQCIRCSCVIGEEVGYGEDWGEGPVCAECIESLEGDDAA